MFKQASIFVSIFFCFLDSYAGGNYASIEISYRWVTGNSYEFTVHGYKNCFGATSTYEFFPYLRIRSTSLNVTYYTSVGINNFWTVQDNSGINPIDAQNCSNTQYRANLMPFPFCFREFTLSRLIALPGQAKDWVIYVGVIHMGASNDTVFDLMSECSINNLDFPDTLAKNNSPFWMNRYPKQAGHLPAKRTRPRTGL